MSNTLQAIYKYFGMTLTPRGILIIILCIVQVRTGSFLDYTSNHALNCHDINSYTEPQLWSVLILHMVDRFFFLVCCPILIIFQVLALVIYCQHKQLRQRPGDIIMGLLITTMVINIHYLATAIYDTIYYNQSMPPSFQDFCGVNGFISIFCSILQTLYLLAMCLHIVISLRSNLKFKQVGTGILHSAFAVVAGLGTFLFWWFKFLGLNIYGMCSVVITNYTIPILIGIVAIIFIVLGYFSLNYFHKHMPDTSGLRLKKRQDAKRYETFIYGISIIEIIDAVFTFVATANCWSQNPNPAVYFVVTLVNIEKLAEFSFLLYISTDSKLFRKQLKKFLRSCFRKKKPQNTQAAAQDGEADGENQGQEQVAQQELQDLLLIPQGAGFTSLDALRVSQVSSIIMGIILSQVEYLGRLGLTQKMRDNYYTEYIFTKYNSGVLVDYNISTKNCPLINIIQSSMIIHAPKMFRNMTLRDNLVDIGKSFDLESNYENMFKIVQAEGGKSGEFFFFTSDDKYILKTISNEEMQFLLDNLSIFDDYYSSHKDSLLAKIYGLYTFRGKQMQRTYHVILMKNILGCSRQNVERLYDTKGSSHDRQVIKPGKMYKYEQLRSMTLKDVDFKKLEGCLHISKEQAEALHKALNYDSLFLKNLNLIDYSLLIAKVTWMNELPPNLSQHWNSIQRMPSTLQPNIFYHVGVIDYMQSWNNQKKAEKWWKMLLGANDVSAQQPDVYRFRFIDFVKSILPIDIDADEPQMKE